MALEATKLASTSKTDIGDMWGSGEGGAGAPGLPNSGFQKYLDSKICFVQFPFDTKCMELIIDRRVWEPRNWPRLEKWIDPLDYLAWTGAVLHKSLFLGIFVPGLPLCATQPAAANTRGSPGSPNCPGNGRKQTFLSKQRIFMAQFFLLDVLLIFLN